MNFVIVVVLGLSLTASVAWYEHKETVRAAALKNEREELQDNYDALLKKYDAVLAKYEELDEKYSTLDGRTKTTEALAHQVNIQLSRVVKVEVTNAKDFRKVKVKKKSPTPLLDRSGVTSQMDN